MSFHTWHFKTASQQLKGQCRISTHKRFCNIIKPATPTAPKVGLYWIWMPWNMLADFYSKQCVLSTVPQNKRVFSRFSIACLSHFPAISTLIDDLKGDCSIINNLSCALSTSAVELCQQLWALTKSKSCTFVGHLAWYLCLPTSTTHSLLHLFKSLFLRNNFVAQFVDLVYPTSNYYFHQEMYLRLYKSPLKPWTLTSQVWEIRHPACEADQTIRSSKCIRMQHALLWQQIPDMWRQPFLQLVSHPPSRIRFKSCLCASCLGQEMSCEPGPWRSQPARSVLVHNYQLFWDKLNTE